MKRRTTYGMEPLVAAGLLVGGLLAGCEPFEFKDESVFATSPNADAGPDAGGNYDDSPARPDSGAATPGNGDGDGSGDGDTGDGNPSARPGRDNDVPVTSPECTSSEDCETGFECRSGECAFVPPERVPTSIVQTAGGHLMRGTSGLRLRLRIGAPSPMGRMSGDEYRLTLGPFAQGARHE